jgi:1-deoxy-D-xylulose-5-phosphate reductoisomerase
MVAAPLTVSVLGATGSIGRSTAQVLETQRHRLRVVAVAGGRDAAALAEVAVRLGAEVAALADPAGYGELRDRLAGSGIEATAGAAAVIEAAARPADWTMAAIAGAAGLLPTVAAARRGGRIALATKECLVCAGPVFLEEIAAGGAVLVPVDSEHNAIFQLMAAGRREDIERVTLTASGGPFRTWSSERIAAARPEDALKHPTWSMGAKITIDSASLMNKGLELIEAKLLFDLDPDALDAIVHPESVVHGLVYFRDGSVVAHLAPPDMRVPIAFALAWPEARVDVGTLRLDLAAVGSLSFMAPDEERFPALRIAKAALRRGGAAPTVLNAANEIAVGAFLERRIGFPAISATVEAALERADRDGLLGTPTTVEEAIGVDNTSRAIARSLLPKTAALAQ